MLARRRRVGPGLAPSGGQATGQLVLLPGNGATAGTVLIGGQWNALWKLTRDGDLTVISISPFIPLPAGERKALTDEALRLLDFLAPGTPKDVRFA